MQKYKVIAALSIGAGVVALTEKQAHTRRNSIKPLGEGLFEVIKPTQFKIGEELGIEGPVPKQLAQALELPKGSELKEIPVKRPEGAPDRAPRRLPPAPKADKADGKAAKKPAPKARGGVI